MSYNQPNQWETLASTILKTELTKHGVKYPDLEEKLEAVGIKCGAHMIRQKLWRGTFSFAFLLQCLKVIGVKNLNLAEYFEQLK